MTKKFQIHKKFEVQNDQPAKNKFEVHENPNWCQQENMNDCGPCMILNSLTLLKIPTEDHSINSVREKVNTTRAQDNTRQPLSPDSWFTSRDIQEYLTQHGLSVREYAGFVDEKSGVEQTVKALFETRNFDLIYVTLGRHFRAILKQVEQLQLLDSFLDGPRNISTEEAWQLISDTISSSTQARIERVGIVNIRR